MTSNHHASFSLNFQSWIPCPIYDYLSHYLLPSATNSQRLCFYTCLSFCPQRVVRGAIPACIAGGIPACLAAGLRGELLPGGCLVQGVCSQGSPGPGGCLVWGTVEAPQKQMATVPDGTHPTGMHSC